jgi:ribonuclease P protein component
MDFRRVYDRRRSASDKWLIVYACENGLPHRRLGLSVSRKVGGAVERNRVKRVLRERFAELAPALPADTDYVVIARPGIADYLERQGSGAVAERLAELTARLAPPSEAGA